MLAAAAEGQAMHAQVLPASAEVPSFLLVETHSPHESNGDEFIELARSLLRSGALVQLHLMQNAVIWLQQQPQSLRALSAEFSGRLYLTVDELSLDLRGLSRSVPLAGVTRQGAVALVEQMARPGVKTLWHS